MKMTRCAACPGKNACLPPDGPTGGILFIGEAPGRDENRRGRVFIGKTGEEVNRHYLPLAGLRRETSCFANAITCLPPSTGGKLDPKRAKDIDMLEVCSAHHLYPLIEKGRFRALVPMGAFACRAVFGQAFDLEMGHGLPAESMWGIPAFPMYHPALGIHEPKKMLMIRTDWHRLKLWLRGKFQQPVDAFPEPDYREVTDEGDIRALDSAAPLGIDTESTQTGEPYCLTFSQHPGSGGLIRAGNHHLVRVFHHHIQHQHGALLVHNWLYDESVLRAMGVGLPRARVIDTMAEVYHLGNLPQGLKALAYRELGMVMESFEDTILPHSRELVLDYYRRAAEEDWPTPDQEMVRHSDTGLWKLYKPQGLKTKLKRFHTDVRKNPDKDVFQTWENWQSHQSQLEEKLGPYPRVCITHAPFEHVLHYACRDADATLRLWLNVLLPMRARVRKVSQEHWRYA